MNDMPNDIVKPTKERMAKAVGFDELSETQAGGVLRKSGAVKLWTQLECLYRNDLLTYEEYRAGQIFYIDWDKSHRGGRVTANYKEWIASFGVPPELDGFERRVFHSHRFQDANKILEEWNARKLVHWVCINDIPVEQVGRKHFGYKGQRSAQSSGRTALQMSLARLAKFYGLLK